MPALEPADFELSPAAERRVVSAEFLKSWARVYKKSPRQLRRWMAEGDAAKNVCPLERPDLMPKWWAAVKHWGTPLWLTQIAEAWTAQNIADKNDANSGAGGAPVAPAESGLGDITAFGLEEGEAVRQAKSVVQAAWKKLLAAHDGRSSESIDLLSRRHASALQALGRVQAAEDAAAKRRGDLVPLGSIRRDLETAVEMLRASRKSMPRRVLELVPGLDPELAIRLSKAIEAVRKDEESVFRMMPTLRDIEDVRKRLGC